MSDTRRSDQSCAKPREKTLSRSAEERARELRDATTTKPGLVGADSRKRKEGESLLGIPDTRALAPHRHLASTPTSTADSPKPQEDHNASSLDGRGQVGGLVQTNLVQSVDSAVASASLRDVLEVLSEVREEQRQLKQAQEAMSRQTIALEAKITELQQELRKHNELIVRFVETDRSSSSSKKEKASKKSNKTETTREDYHRQTERVVEPPRRVCYVYRTKSAQRTSLQFEREIETQLNDLLSSHVKPSGGLFSSFWSPGQPKTDYWTVQPFQGGRRVPSRSPVVVLTFAEGVRVDEEELNHAFAELSASDCVPLLIATLRYGDRSQPALLPEGWRKPGGRELLCLNFAFGRTGLVDHLTKESIVQLATLLNSD